MIFSVLLENTFFVVAAVSAGIDVVAAVADVVKASCIGHLVFLLFSYFSMNCCVPQSFQSILDQGTILVPHMNTSVVYGNSRLFFRLIGFVWKV